MIDVIVEIDPDISGIDEKKSINDIANKKVDLPPKFVADIPRFS